MNKSRRLPGRIAARLIKLAHGDAGAGLILLGCAAGAGWWLTRPAGPSGPISQAAGRGAAENTEVLPLRRAPSEDR